jgi:hypothetical protein
VQCQAVSGNGVSASSEQTSSVTPGTVVYVRVPAGHGTYRLVTVIGWSMSAKHLVSITTEALASKS